MALGLEERSATLGVLARALRREAHVLATRPDLAWQQLHNRLQWAPAPAGEILRRDLEVGRTRTVPWIWLKSPFAESDALERVLSHPGSVCACEFSRDGTFLVTASEYGTLRIWDWPAASERAVLDDWGTWAKGFEISADGSVVLSIDGSARPQLWDATTGHKAATFRGHTSWSYSWAISPDGSFVASGDADGAIKLWEASSGAELDTLSGHTGTVYDCAFSPDGSSLVTASDDSTLKIWPLRAGTAVGNPTELVGHGDAVKECTFSPDGTLVASRGADGVIRIWDASDGTARDTLQGAAQTKFRDLAFSPDGKLVVWHGYSELRIWDAVAGAVLPALTEPLEGSFDAFAISPDCEFVVSADLGGTVRVWDPRTGEERATLAGHAGAAAACAVSPDGGSIVSGGDDGTVRVWDVETALRPDVRDEESRPILRASAWPRDGSFIASVDPDSAATVWQANTGTGHPTSSGYWWSALAVSPDASFKVCRALAGGSLEIRDAATGAVRFHLDGHDQRVNACAISPDAMFIVSASDDKTLKVWQPGRTEAQETLRGHDSAVKACAFSPDGSFVVSASSDRSLVVWDVATWDERARLEGHSSFVLACAVSRNGRSIASAGLDGEVKIWEPEAEASPSPVVPDRWRVRTTLHGHREANTCMFSSDGAFVLSSGFDPIATVKLWSITEGVERAALPFSGLHGVTLQPGRPSGMCCDRFGNIYEFELMGIAYGAVVVTAVDRGRGPTIVCPGCGEEHAVDRGRLGTVIDCPAAACDLRLRVNQFVITRPRR